MQSTPLVNRNTKTLSHNWPPLRLKKKTANVVFWRRSFRNLAKENDWLKILMPLNDHRRRICDSQQRVILLELPLVSPLNKLVNDGNLWVNLRNAYGPILHASDDSHMSKPTRVIKLDMKEKWQHILRVRPWLVRCLKWNWCGYGVSRIESSLCFCIPGKIGSGYEYEFLVSPIIPTANKPLPRYHNNIGLCYRCFVWYFTSPDLSNSMTQNIDNSSLRELSNSAIDLVPFPPFVELNHWQQVDRPRQTQFHIDYISSLAPATISVYAEYPITRHSALDQDVVHLVVEGSIIRATLYPRISRLEYRGEIEGRWDVL